MRGLIFEYDVARLALAKAGGVVTRKAFSASRAPVRLAEIPEPEPPGPGWVVCETRWSGICGSDVKQILLKGSRDNPLTALLSFPHVLGHEAVATRSDTGQRVALNPWLTCVPRGIAPPCSACLEGNYPACRNFTEGCVGRSLHIGNCETVNGTHADRFCAHESQLFPIPEGIPDSVAVLADPVSVSLHAILKRPPIGDRPVLIYGCGTLGIAAIALLRMLYPDTEVWCIARPGVTAELAARFGASQVLQGTPDELVAEIARLSGATTLQPWSGKGWLQDGPGVVYDMVGTPESVETSLRFLCTRGSLVIAGVEAPRRFEWTPLYFKEIEVVGSNAFGVETVDGVSRHAFEHYFGFVRRGLDLSDLITHRFALEDWAEAITTITKRRRTGAMKVLLHP